MSDAIIPSKASLAASPEGLIASRKIHREVSKIKSPTHQRRISAELAQAVYQNFPTDSSLTEGWRSDQEDAVPVFKQKIQSKGVHSEWVDYINRHAQGKKEQRKREKTLSSGETIPMDLTPADLGDSAAAPRRSDTMIDPGAPLLDQPGMDYATYKEVEPKQKKDSRLINLFKRCFCC